MTSIYEHQKEDRQITQRILVIGDAMIDSYKNCSMERISPEAPVPVLNFQKQFFRLGGAANLAAGIVAMEIPCDLLALSGEDSNGQLLGKLISESGIGDLLLSVSERPTIVKERIMAMRQQICRIDYENHFNPDHSRLLMEKAVSLLDAYDIFVISDYGKGFNHHLDYFMQQAASKNARILIDPKQDDWSIYAGAYLIKPNWKEFQAAAQFERMISSANEIAPTDHSAISDVATKIMQRHNVKHLVITLGADGYVHLTKDGTAAPHPTRAREVFDLSGAGDSFLATLTAFLAQGVPLASAIEFGNTAAGIAVGHVGTSVVSRAELKFQTTDITTDDLKLALLKEFAVRGKRIAFTNGCFDILHTGHLDVLRQAKAAGDILVVGVNTDASVSRLKGPSRPITSLEDRIALLESLEPVDIVLPFDEDTPQNLINAVQPDVLVKGGDYDEDSIVGADVVKSRGGKIIIVPLKEGRSTTKIISHCSSK